MKTGQQQLSFLNILLLATGAGIWLASAFAVPLAVWCALLAVLFLLAGCLLWRSSPRTDLVFVLLFFVLGGLRFLAADHLPATDISWQRGEEAEISGIVQEAPRRLEDGEGGLKLRYLVAVQRITKAGGTVQTGSGSLYVYAHLPEGQAAPAVRIGDEVTAGGVIKGLHGFQNPGRMDTVQAARARGVTAQLSAGKRGVAAAPAEQLLFLRRMEEIRVHYLAGMQAVMPAADAAAIFAMLFGGYEGIRPELLEAFTTTGIVHILSVSGSHITLLAGTIAWLGSLLHFRRGVTAVLVVLAIVSYGALAGGVPPVIRSGLMGMLTFLALVWERERDAQRILTLTGLVMLLVSPLLLFDISFQLSFAATAGLLYIAPRLRPWLARLPAAVGGALAITLGAQLAVLPLLAWYFHVVSLSSLLANLVAVPIVEAMIVLGLVGGLIGFVLPVLAKIIFVADSLLLGLVYELTRAMARLPGSQVYLPAMGTLVSGLYYMGLSLFLQPAELRCRLQEWCRRHGRGLAVAAAGSLLAFGSWSVLRPAELAVHFIDVGQGDAALVVTPHGRAFMIDCGGTRDNAFDVGGRVDVPYLLHYGVHELDYIFLTHVHEDHAAGAGGILKKLPVKMIMTGSEGRAAYMKSLALSAAEAARTEFVAAQAGQQAELDGVTVEVLYAPTAPPAGSGRQTGNEVSNVIRVRYGRASFLFTGDLVKEQELALLQAANPQSTVLKVGHHGSRTSTSAEFVRAVAPEWAVISVGAENRFGHPNPEPLAELARRNVKLYRTDENGAVVFYTDGETMRVEPYVR